MESDLNEVADYALEQPGVTGYICVDKEGLCLTAKGQANQSLSGIVNQIATLASKLEERPKKNDSVESPVVRVDLDKYKMTIQSRDSIATALISSSK